MTWIAFFCILWELDWKWTTGHHELWHSILGLIVLVCAFLGVGFSKKKNFDILIESFVCSQSSAFYVQHLVQFVIVSGIGFIG